MPVPGRRDPDDMTNDTTINPRTPIGLLTGKVVFITGASRGIGAAAARLFAALQSLLEEPAHDYVTAAVGQAPG